MSRKIAEAMLSIDAVGFRPGDPVRFKSGILSPVYCDNRQFPFWPEQWSKVIEGFSTLIDREGLRFDAIAGIEAAGIPHSAALGYALKRPSAFVRKAAKEHGTKKRVEGGSIAGKQVLLVEDLVTTGGSSLSGVEALRAEGGIVTDCLAIISYGFAEAASQFEAAGVRLHPLTSFGEVLEVALEHGRLNAAEAAIVRDWFHDPYGWESRTAAA
jgi:orotate phosphoribosyltransferase